VASLHDQCGILLSSGHFGDSLRYVKLLAITVAILSIVTPASPCKWARGYFYQVTRLRGRVVGAKLGPLQYVGWLRRSFVRKHAELTLYSYRDLIKTRSDMNLVKKSISDDDGNFDFGSLAQGHYTLIIEDARWGSSDWFDVEIKTLPRQTDSVTVDISPNFPDCKGGHEFIVASK
jgi:hypothetical protein